MQLDESIIYIGPNRRSDQTVVEWALQLTPEELEEARKEGRFELLGEPGATPQPERSDIEQLLREPFEEDDSAANGSSIAFIAEYKSHRILLAGDAHPSTLPQGVEFNELNFEFHIRIAAAGKNRFLQKVHYGIRIQAERFSYVTFIQMMENNIEKREYLQNISKQHHEIIRCLENYDQTRITDLVAKHVIFFQNQIFSSMMEISYA